MKEYTKKHNVYGKNINLSFSCLSKDADNIARYIEQKLPPTETTLDSKIEGIQCRVMQKPNFIHNNENYFVLLQIKLNKTLIIFRETGKSIYQIIDIISEKIRQAFLNVMAESKNEYVYSRV